MKIKHFTPLVTSSVIGVGVLSLPPTFDWAQASNWLTRPSFAGSYTAAASSVGVDLAAASELPNPQIYIEGTTNLAIRGADPVAYFTDNAAIPGSPEYEYEWNGAIWHFSSAENLQAFQANPEAYAPQYGGYCAKAVSEGNLVSIDPRAWKIVDGKLYLNYNLEVQAQWEQDVQDRIAKANTFWPAVLTEKTLFENQITWAE